MQGGWQIGNQRLPKFQDEPILDNLKIIQHEQRGFLQFQEFVDQRGAEDLFRGKRTGSQQSIDLQTQVGIYRLEGGN